MGNNATTDSCVSAAPAGRTQVPHISIAPLAYLTYSPLALDPRSMTAPLLTGPSRSATAAVFNPSVVRIAGAVGSSNRPRAIRVNGVVHIVEPDVKYGIISAAPVIPARALTLTLDPTLLKVRMRDLA
ncbi:hypothetical protein D3C86_1602880 [compost metagenome]